jgi:hypothetical protein
VPASNASVPGSCLNHGVAATSADGVPTPAALRAATVNQYPSPVPSEEIVAFGSGLLRVTLPTWVCEQGETPAWHAYSATTYFVTVSPPLERRQPPNDHSGSENFGRHTDACTRWRGGQRRSPRRPRPNALLGYGRHRKLIGVAGGQPDDVCCGRRGSHVDAWTAPVVDLVAGYFLATAGWGFPGESDLGFCRRGGEELGRLVEGSGTKETLGADGGPRPVAVKAETVTQ